MRRTQPGRMAGLFIVTPQSLYPPQFCRPLPAAPIEMTKK
jgi:hypothetical protein